MIIVMLLLHAPHRVNREAAAKPKPEPVALKPATASREEAHVYISYVHTYVYV